MSTVAVVTEPKERVGFKRVLMATDFSETSLRTLAYAVVLARIYGSELLLVHVLTPKQGQPVPQPPVLCEFDKERIAAGQRLKKFADEGHLEKHACQRII